MHDLAGVLSDSNRRVSPAGGRPSVFFFFFSSRRRHTRLQGDWSSDVCSSDLRFDESDFRHRVSDLVAEHADTALDRIDAGQVVLRIQRIAADTWFRLPPEFTMIAKTLMNLDRVVYILAPNFDPNAIIKEEATSLILRNVVKSVEPSKVMSGVLEIKEFVEKFPGRINKILDVIGNNELKIGVDAMEERVVPDGLRKD